jgi:molybdopterin adenylyltransferase
VKKMADTPNYDPVKIGLVTISDRASKGVYQDEGIPALESWLSSVLLNPLTLATRIIPDEQSLIESTLKSSQRLKNWRIKRTAR